LKRNQTEKLLHRKNDVNFPQVYNYTAQESSSPNSFQPSVRIIHQESKLKDRATINSNLARKLAESRNTTPPTGKTARVINLNPIVINMNLNFEKSRILGSNSVVRFAAEPDSDDKRNS
jgi:hypothetical protein